MLFSFNINRPKDIKATFRKVKARLERHNGKISGDESNGYITVEGIEGSYACSAESIKVVVNKKPSRAIPNWLIEKQIRNIFCELCG